MGRRAYLNRLALGRSPYEAPESSTDPSTGQTNPTQRRTSSLHADGYVQEYDERGHAINPESRSFGKDLRRAKNDILSTMGIVVSEDGNRGRSEQQKIDIIVAENDYGLVMVTLDQISVFLGSWWTSSLTGRIQTFKSYAHTPLMNIISQERASLGTLGFYFAGVPAWAVSTCLSICRHHPLERLTTALMNRFPNNDAQSKIVRASFTVLHSAARGTLLVLAMQTYMYSLLQSLHLIHPASLPSAGFFMPFGQLASMQIPNFPAEISLNSIMAFVLNLLKTPSLFYVYVYLRPFIEIRLYRFIRRRLPKPTITDDLSIKVALDNDLIDWMVPTLGRRAEEEVRRSNLSLMDDLLYEFKLFRQLVASKLGFTRKQTSHAVQQVVDTNRRREWLDSLPASIEQVQDERRSREQESQMTQPLNPLPLEDQTASGGGALFNPVNLPNSTPNADIDTGGRISTSGVLAPQPPAGMIDGGLPSINPLGDSSNIPAPPSISPLPIMGMPLEDSVATGESRSNSRSNTLFSHPSSSSSSPSSPRVRAQLIQNSDVIAMQLEVGSRRPHNHEQIIPRVGNEDRQNSNGAPHDRRSISELLDSLLSNQGQRIAINSEPTDSDGLSNMTAGVSPEIGVNTTTSVPQSQPESPLDERSILGSAAGVAGSIPAHILPDGVEEPSQDDTNNQLSEIEPNLENDFDSEIFPRISDPNVRQTPPTSAPITAHRVTILSALPVDSLASHLASMTTTALFSPLESFYLRALAASYLASTGASSTLRSDIYPLGLWFGGRTRSDALMYMGKLALMMGVQAAVNASVWGVISGTAIRIGRRWCGWGSL